MFRGNINKLITIKLVTVKLTNFAELNLSDYLLLSVLFIHKELMVIY